MDFPLKNCSSFKKGKWEESGKLEKERDGHSSWSTELGIVLMGGKGAEDSTEIIDEYALNHRLFNCTLKVICNIVISLKLVGIECVLLALVLLLLASS